MPRDKVADPLQAIADLQRDLAQCRAERDDALAREAATAEVLQVINSSPGDLAPVFEAILEKAHNLCGAAHGALTTYDGKHFRAVALHAMPEQFGKLLLQPFPPYAGGAQEPLLQGEPLVHIPDILARHYSDTARVYRRRHPHLADGAVAQGRYVARLYHRPSARGPAVY
jgi:hypothetical protein